MRSIQILLVLALAPGAWSAAADSPDPEKDGFIAREAHAWQRAAAEAEWTGALLLGAGVTLASSALDRRAWDGAGRRSGSAGWASAVRTGNALPFVALGTSAVLAAGVSELRLARTSLAAFEAGAAAVVVAQGLKVAAGRARPDAGLGNNDFDPFSNRDERASFPSRHAAVMWAAVTPYAREYDLPWLYALAAVTNVARVASREHWLSDTVGGSLIGYGLGRLALQAQAGARTQGSARTAQLVVGPRSVALVWSLP